MSYFRPFLVTLALALALPLLPARGVTILEDDFEDGNLNGWTEGAAGHWANSTTTPITGSRSLKHNLNAIAGNSHIYATPFYDLSDERTVWRFNMKNGGWDPSFNNKFYVYLLADDPDLGGSPNGYAVGINFNVSDDLVKLWRIAGGSVAAEVITSTVDWDAAKTIGIEVTRETDGTWELKIDSNGGFDSLISAGTAVDTFFDETTFFGFYFSYTSTRAGQFWADDVSIKQEPAPVNAPPTFGPAPDRTVNVSNLLEFTVFASEPDGDAVTMTASNLPSGAVFIPSNGTSTASGTIQFTPTLAQGNQSFPITFYAEDTDGSTSTVVTVNVQIPSACGVIFSKYIEGSGFNKGVEIHNGTDFAIDLAAQQYLVQIYGNGSPTPTITVNLEGVLPSTKTHVVVHPTAGGALMALADQIGNMNFNGDDALVLRSGGAAGPILDSIGQVGVDPGSRWGSAPVSTVDATLVRKLTVTSGRTDSTSAFNPALEWDGLPKDDFTGVGVHDNGCGTLAPPVSPFNDMSLVGDFNGFNPSNDVMELVADNTWKIRLININQPTNRFQFVANKSYPAGQWGETNQTVFTLPIDATAEVGGFGKDIVVSENLAGFFDFTFNDSTLAYSITRARPEQMAVAGTFNGWNNTPNMVSTGEPIWKYTFQFANETNLEFKFVANADWGINWGETNQTDLLVPVAGVAEAIGNNIVVPGVLDGPYRFTFNHETLDYSLAFDQDAPVSFSMNFNTWPSTSGYGTYDFEGWTVADGLISSVNARSGQAGRLQDTTPGTDTHFIQSPSNSAGLGSLTFWYRHWDGNSPAITFKVQKSSTGVNGSWTDVETISGVLNTDYMQHVTELNDLSNHFVRIKRSSGNERLLVDDIFFTSDTNSAIVVIDDVFREPPLPYTNDEVSISANFFPANDANDLVTRLFYRIGTDTNLPFTAVDMVPVSTFRRAAISDIPAQGIGTQVFYYLQADFTGPGSAHTSPVRFPLGSGLLSYGIPRNPPGSVWINEYDYKSVNEDFFFDQTNEFIELAGAAGIDLSGWSLELLNGQSTSFLVFDTHTISNGTVLADDSGGFGFWVWGMAGITNRDVILTSYLSNNEPGGIRLLNEFGGVEELVAFGGLVPDYTWNGDLDPDDPFGWPHTNSLALTGSGFDTNFFTWTTNVASPGAVNPGQVFALVPSITCPADVTVACTNDVPVPDVASVLATGICGDLTVTVTHVGDTDNGGVGCPADPLIISRTYRAVSDCDTTNECVQTISVIDDIPPTLFFVTPVSDTNVLHDASTNLIHGVYTNEPILGLPGATPQTGNSVGFNGINQRGIITNGALPSAMSQFTISAWVYPDTTNSGVMRIVGLPGIQCRRFSLDNNHLVFSSMPHADYVSAATVPSGTWSQVTVTFDAADNATFYVNGSSMGTVAASGVSGVCPPVDADYFDGRLDDVQIYDAALPPGDVAGLFSNPGNPTNPSLVAHYRLDEQGDLLTRVPESGCTAPLPDLVSAFSFSSSDNCGGSTVITQSPPAGASAFVGDTVVTVSSIDDCDNIASAVFTVRVLDVEAPIISSCPSNVTVECGGGASDNASFGTYQNGWQTGDNGGSGWGGPWTLASNNVGTTFFFIGNSTQNGSANDTNGDGDINTAGFNAWGIFASGTDIASAARPFASSLGNGNSVQLDMDNGFIEPGGRVGFGLQNTGSGLNRFSFYFQGGDANYTVLDNGGLRDTGLGFTDEGLRVRFVLTGPDTYDLELTRLVDGAATNVSGTLTGSSGLGIDRLRLFNENGAGFSGGSIFDAYYNSINVTILPAVDTNGVVATDACSSFSVTHEGDVTDGGCPETITRTYRATDTFGNFSECQQSIVLQDTQPPSVICLTNTMTVAASANCQVLTPDLSTNVSATDACGLVALTQHPATNEFIALGTTDVTVVALDCGGNTNTCVISLVVQDQTQPDIACSGNRAGNPSMEEGSGNGSQQLNNWTLFGNVFQEGALPRTGLHVAKLYGRFTGSLNFSGLYQDHEAIPGQSWSTSVYALNPSTDPMGAGNDAFLKLEFYDGVDFVTPLAAFASAHITSATPQNSYQFLTVSGTAPAGTMVVRTAIIFQQASGQAGSTYFDDVELLLNLDSSYGDIGDVPAADTSHASATDNCDPNPAVTFEGQSDNGGSGASGDPLVITRTYRATDAAGLFSECQQVFTVEAGINPPPAAVDITRIDHLGAGVVVIKSTGTNSWTADAEYSTNLVLMPQQWMTLPAVSNLYLNGTNMTWFGVPDTVTPYYIRILNTEP